MSLAAASPAAAQQPGAVRLKKFRTTKAPVRGRLARDRSSRTTATGLGSSRRRTAGASTLGEGTAARSSLSRGAIVVGQRFARSYDYVSPDAPLDVDIAPFLAEGEALPADEAPFRLLIPAFRARTFVYRALGAGTMSPERATKLLRRVNRLLLVAGERHRLQYNAQQALATALMVLATPEGLTAAVRRQALALASDALVKSLGELGAHLADQARRPPERALHPALVADARDRLRLLFEVDAPWTKRQRAAIERARHRAAPFLVATL